MILVTACQASDSLILEVEGCDTEAGGADCVGSMALTVSGLPSGMPASIRITGPQGFAQDVTDTQTLSDLEPGPYVISIAGVTDASTAQAPGSSAAPGGTPGRVWNPRDKEKRVNVKRNERTDVTIDYEAISMIVMIDGLPTGMGAAVSVDGPAGFRADLTVSDSLADLRDGDYDVQAVRSGPTGSAYFAGTPDQLVPVASDATSMASVSYSGLAEIEVTPETVTLAPGESWAFDADGRLEDGSDVDVDVDWSTDGGTISNDGSFVAGSTEGTFTVVGSFEGSESDTVTVVVESEAPTITAITLSPTSVSLESGQRRRFTATADMSDGSQVAATVTWSATGGTINTNGRYTAGNQEGSFTVTGTHASGLEATSTVDVTVPAPPTVTSVSLSPSQVTLQSGATQQFQAIAQMSDGSTQPVLATWTTTAGTITAGGLLTAGNAAGTFEVRGTHDASGQSGTSSVDVDLPAVVTGITVSPDQASLLFGDVGQFDATLQWSDGSTTNASPTWTATGGSVTAGGRYTAGNSAGSFEVIADDASGFADTASVSVQAPPPPPSGSPDPTMLPVATTSHDPRTAAYNALNVGSIPVGGFYEDPTTGVKVYRLTNGSYPTSSPRWGHDYSEGGNEISLPHTGATRSIIVRQNGGPYWLVDFTPGVGVSNERRLPNNLYPVNETAFTFSSDASTPYYAFVATGNEVVRFDVRSMTEAPGDGWPVQDQANTWLHQSYDDGLFTWLRADARTAVGYEPSTGTLKSYSGAVNEPRIDRGGRYIGLVMDSPDGANFVWDWETDQIVWQTDGVPPFGHNASLRRLWIGVDVFGSYPPDFTAWRPDVANSEEYFGGPANASAFYGNGNWNQPNAAVNDQWALMSNYDGVFPVSGDWGWLAPGGMIYITHNGERRLLGHPYNSHGEYTWYSFVKQSPDGHYVQFTSDMNGSNRSDVFLVEVPRR